MEKPLKKDSIYKNDHITKVRKLLKGELGLLLILAVLIVTFMILSPYFFTSRNLLNITRQISITLIVAIGMTFVILTGEIDLSVGSLAALAGVAAAAAINATGSILIGIIAGLVMGFAMGAINGLLIVYGKVQSFIVTLAMLGIARGIALVWTGGKPISGLPISFGTMGAGYVGMVPVSTIIAAGVFLIAYYFMNRTKHGIYMRSIGANTEAAKLSAIPVKKYRIIAFLISGLLSGLGGILITSRLLSAQPTAAEGMELNVIAAVILGGASLSGGIGTILGTLLGAMVIGVIDNGMNLVGVSAFFQQIVKGIIILIAVMAKRGE
ncbi:MAG TPA: ABC transporter permease [Thermotogota bacterium]|nr:ABC transporter permease [Thermotogota bacterium]HPJ88053.1 ABC transporter permease [Thermotogota bacterium]HPR96238.1 ABC transporter permease [Thermotogota bacterium]